MLLERRQAGSLKGFGDVPGSPNPKAQGDRGERGERERAESQPVPVRLDLRGEAVGADGSEQVGQARKGFMGGLPPIRMVFFR